MTIDNIKFNFNLISKYRTQLMGIAILEVLIAHSFAWLNFPEKFIHLSSKMVFTQGFLLLSGLGLYYSYSKNKSIINFYLRRIQRVWFPYMLMATPFVLLISHFREDITPIKIIGWITSIGYFFPGKTQYCNMWYIAMSLFCYSIFPLVYNFIFLNKKYIYLRSSLVIVLSIVIPMYLYIYHRDYYELVSLALPKGCMFFLGILIGYLSQKNYSIIFFKLLLVTCIFLLIMLYIKNINLFINNYYSIAEKLLLIPLICYIFYKIEIENLFINKFLSWFGKYTLELYVLHLMIKQILTLLDFTPGLIVSLSIGISILLCRPCNKTINKISNYIIHI